MAEPIISCVEYKESTVTPVPICCVWNNVYNTSQTRVVHNRHPTHHRNHNLSPCPNTRVRKVKQKQQKRQKHRTSQQSTKVETGSAKGSHTEGADVSEDLDNQHKHDNISNVSLTTYNPCKRCSENTCNSETNKNQPTASIPSVHNENKLSDSKPSRRSSAKSSASLSIRRSRSSENICTGKENLRSGRNTSTGAEGDDNNTARSHSIPGRENLWSGRSPSAEDDVNDNDTARSHSTPGKENLWSGRRNASARAIGDARVKDRDMIKRKQKKPFRDKQVQMTVDHGPIRTGKENKQDGNIDKLVQLTVNPSPLGTHKENKKDGNVDYSNLKQQLRDLTNLPYGKIRRPTQLVTYPAKRSKGSGKGGNRRGQANRANTSRGAAEGTQELPIQTTDTSAESLRRPSRDRVVTSAQSVYGSITASILPIPAICTLAQEQGLISRMRGETRTTSNQDPRSQDRSAVPPRHPNYVTLSSRQESFRNWPSNTGQDSSRMAVYGFYFTGQSDLIRCFQCGIGLKDWSAGDEPLFEHIRHSSQCPFLRELLGNELLNAYRENLHMTGSNRGATNAPNSDRDRIRNPNYETLRSRLASFSNWPSTGSQTPQTLADAGLFYTGFNDLCRCFHCDGGLQRWEAEDTPWVEHARWFPHCAYVKQIKGQAYINMVRRAAEEAQREEEDPPVYANKIRERQVGSQAREHSSASNLVLYNRGLNPEGMGAVELGFSRVAVQQAIEEYNRREDRRGVEYNTEDLVNILTTRIDNGETLPSDPSDNEGATAVDPEEENRRLKGIVKCMICKINETNMLFLPCTHHRLCETCAETVVNCPVCNKFIKEKIKTYMS